MGKLERVCICCSLVSVLSIVLMVGALADVSRIERVTESRISAIEKELNAVIENVNECSKTTDERIRVLDGEVDYFISGKWK